MKYKNELIIGTILILVAVAGATLYMSDYRRILESNPDQDLFLIKNVSGDRIELLGRSDDYEFVKWRYQDDKAKLYHGSDLKLTSYWQVFEGTSGVWYNEKDAPKSLIDVNDKSAKVVFEIDYFGNSRHTNEKGYLKRQIDITSTKNKESITWIPSDNSRYNFKWILILDDYQGESQKIEKCNFEYEDITISWCDAKDEVTTARIYKTSKRLVVRFKSAEGYRFIDPTVESGSEHISLNYSINVDTSFILNSSNLTALAPVGQNSTYGAINVSNLNASENITVWLKVNYTNVPIVKYLLDEGFDSENWTVFNSTTTNTTTNWTFLCSDFQPFPVSGYTNRYRGRFRYNFNTTQFREYYNSSGDLVNATTLFDCGNAGERRLQFYIDDLNVTEKMQSLSISILDDNSSNNLTITYNASNYDSIVMNTSDWQNITLTLPTIFRDKYIHYLDTYTKSSDITVIKDMDVYENILYLLSDPITGSRITSLNITNYSDINFLDNLTIEAGLFSDVFGISVTNNTALVTTAGRDELLSFNITDPTNIALLDNISGLGRAEAVYAKDYIVYVVDSTDDIMYVYNFTDPTSLVNVGNFSIPFNILLALDIYVDDNYAYITEGIINDRFYILNVTNLTNIELLSNISGSGSPNYLNGVEFIYAEDNIVYTSSPIEPSFGTFDVSNISDIVYLDSYRDFSGTPNRFVVNDNIAFIADDSTSSELILINVTNSSNLVEIDTLVESTDNPIDTDGMININDGIIFLQTNEGVNDGIATLETSEDDLQSFTINFTINEKNNYNTSLSSIYFRDFYLYSTTNASDYYTIKVNIEDNYSTSTTLTTAYQQILNISAAAQHYVWLWLDVNFPPLGMNFDVAANATYCGASCGIS